MWARSPLPAPFLTAGQLFSSVTAHGTAMAYVLTIFFIMGFGYYVAETASRGRCPPRAGRGSAFWLGVAGALMAIVTIFSGRAAVLFTFYPPLTASVLFYIGLVLVVAASWIWCVLMLLAMSQMETRQSRAARAARHVRNRRQRRHVAVDHGRRRGGAPLPDHSRRLGLEADDRRRPLAHPLLLDAARDRLLLAHPVLHRLLHDGAAGRGRAALQRHHGPPHLRPVPDLQPAGGPASPADGPAPFQRLQVPAGGADRARVGADAADRVHYRARRWRLPAGCEAGGACSAGSARCPGTGRWCSRPGSHS